MRYLLVALPFFVGCAMARHEVKVLRSKSEIQVQTFELEKKDVILCDSQRCRVVQP